MPFEAIKRHCPNKLNPRQSNLIDRDLIIVFMLKIALIFLFVEEKIFFTRIVGPNIFYTLIYLTFIFHFL